MAAPGTKTFIRETSAGKSNVCAWLQGLGCKWNRVESTAWFKEDRTEGLKSLLKSVFRLVDFCEDSITAGSKIEEINNALFASMEAGRVSVTANRIEKFASTHD
jgi:hypothetical protein